MNFSVHNLNLPKMYAIFVTESSAIYVRSSMDVVKEEVLALHGIDFNGEFADASMEGMRSVKLFSFDNVGGYELAYGFLIHGIQDAKEAWFGLSCGGRSYMSGWTGFVASTRQDVLECFRPGLVFEHLDFEEPCEEFESAKLEPSRILLKLASRDCYALTCYARDMWWSWNVVKMGMGV